MQERDLAVLLRSLAESVESGDSMEGSLEYLIPDEGFGLCVRAAYRVGNRDGQGGMVTIGEQAPAPDGLLADPVIEQLQSDLAAMTEARDRLADIAQGASEVLCDLGDEYEEEAREKLIDIAELRKVGSP